MCSQIAIFRAAPHNTSAVSVAHQPARISFADLRQRFCTQFVSFLLDALATFSNLVHTTRLPLTRIIACIAGLSILLHLARKDHVAVVCSSGASLWGFTLLTVRGEVQRQSIWQLYIRITLLHTQHSPVSCILICFVPETQYCFSAE